MQDIINKQNEIKSVLVKMGTLTLEFQDVCKFSVSDYDVELELNIEQALSRIYREDEALNVSIISMVNKYNRYTVAT